jgi:hypothetical protein
MHPDELDRLLSHQEVIAPSAGFAEAVMAKIAREGERAPSSAFPWRRILAGLTTAVCCAAGAGLTIPASVSASQFGRVADRIGIYVNALLTDGPSATVVSLVLAVAFMLIPLTVYEITQRGAAEYRVSPRKAGCR